MSSLQINLLGRFEILVDGERVDQLISKSKKGSMLIQYLLLRRGEAVSYAELYEVLWPNEESANPESALKTLVSRLRVLMSKISDPLGECVSTARGSYCWNTAVDCSVDLFEFEDLSTALLKTANEDAARRMELYKQAIKVYHGGLLPSNEQESWVITRSVYLQNKYMELVYQYLDLLEKDADYEEMIRVCRRALEINAFEERLHVKLMDTLVRTNRNNEALMQYKHATSIHFRYLGMKPPEGIQEFYKQIVRAGHVMDGDIDAIRRDLCAYHEMSGAFVCEYAVFKEIYNLQVRSCERGQATMFLGLLLVSNADGQPIESLQLDEIMKRLLDVLKTTLRKGDTITHHTASQYALLLPLKAYEDGEIVVERIKNVFYRRYPNSSVIISHRIAPIMDVSQSKADFEKRWSDKQKKAEKGTK